MVGFVQTIPTITGEKYSVAEHKASCFYGMQDKKYNIETTTEEAAKEIKYATISSHGPQEVTNIQLESDINRVFEHSTPRAHNKRSNPHHDHVPSDEMDLLIQTINENDFGWKADTCKLQKSHKMYS